MKDFLELAFALVLLWVVPAATQHEEFAYDDYAAVLEDYVDDDGFVDYAELKKRREPLDHFAQAMANLKRENYDAWDESAKIAFWINAYNALTLELIIDHYPIESSVVRGLVWPKNSIRQIDGAWTDIEFTVMGEAMTLDHIEHKILRAEFSEPRIHMALVCAARSCPHLRREPYRGDVLDMQLTDQSRMFLANPGNYLLDRKAKQVRLSAIFDWFKADFVTGFAVTREGMSDKDAAVINFVSTFAEQSDRDYLRNTLLDIEYADYDWTLNER